MSDTFDCWFVEVLDREDRARLFGILALAPAHGLAALGAWTGLGTHIHRDAATIESAVAEVTTVETNGLRTIRALVDDLAGMEHVGGFRLVGPGPEQLELKTGSDVGGGLALYTAQMCERLTQ